MWRVEQLLMKIFDAERLKKIFGRTDTEVAKLQDALQDIEPGVVGPVNLLLACLPQEPFHLVAPVTPTSNIPPGGRRD